MKRFQIHVVLTFISSILGAQSQKNLAEPLKLEWKSELVVPNGDFDRMTDIVRIENSWIFAVATDNGSVIYKISDGLKPSYSYTIPHYLTHIHARNQDYFTKEHCNVNRRSFSNEVLESNCFMMQPDWSAGSSVSAFTDNYLFHAEGDSFLKFDLKGNLIFRDKIGDLVNSQLITQGGAFVYVFSQITNPAHGSRLMQYDTLGNQKWNLPMGAVNNILADKTGNCYVFSLVPQKSNIVTKYNSEGNVIWSKEVTGQTVGNGFLHGDSLLVCGIETIEAAHGNMQNPTFSILSANDGKILYQQKFDFYPTEESYEAFTHVATDGKAIFLGGTTGGQGARNFLVKLSREGNTTGLKETNTRTGFNIFPNPGGTKFTITCENGNNSPLDVIVRNISGQVVCRKQLVCNADRSFSLDLGKQAAGHYTIEIGSGSGMLSKKIIVE